METVKYCSLGQITHALYESRRAIPAECVGENEQWVVVRYVY